jgi:3-phenylpropionate/trans-cinnamate dioxygenase ferredoxin reductase subunit
MRIVVVGASLAGVRTAQALRRLGHDGPLVLLDSHPRVAVDRPPLSKAYLAGDDPEPRDLLTDEQSASLDLELVLGQPATSLDLEDREVCVDGGRRLSYDRLVLACGSRPRTLGRLTDQPGVHLLRTEVDALALRDALARAARVLIVGGGFIGAEVAWTAHRRGVAATIVEPLPALMIRGLGPDLGQVMTERHRRLGTDVRLGVGVEEVTGEPGRLTTRLSDGSTVDSDLVLVGVGTVPATGWLEGSGLTIDDGVHCDGTLAAVGAPDVWAVGDVARWWHPRLGETIRVEHWTNAVEQSGVVAKNVLGAGQPYDAMPYVWSDQLGTRLQIVGRVRPDDQVHFVVGTADDAAFVAVTGDGSRVHAVVGVGATRELMPYRKALVDGAAWDDVVTRRAPVSPGTP